MDQQIKLNDGNQIPAIGFGTAQLRGNGGQQAITAAINNGYHFLDSAFNYDNEGAVGAAVRQSSVPREQITVMSKLPGRYHAYQDALNAIEESLFRMQLDYFDLYLIHWPNPQQDQYVSAWQALIEAQKRGDIKSIGVSNFLPEHTMRLIKETDVIPAVNEIQVYPYFNNQAGIEFDQQHAIQTIGWSPLGRSGNIYKDPALLQNAADENKSVAQVVLRWELQQGVIPIPRSHSAHHQLENRAIFDFKLNQQQMAKISSLSQIDGRSADQNPATHEQH